MNDLIDQIRKALDHHLYYLALYAALILPSICAALESEDGSTTGKDREKYAQWVDKYLSPFYTVLGKTSLTGDDLYYFRCAVLHQGRSGHSKGYTRIVLTEQHALHNNLLKNKALNLDLSIFCNDMIFAVECWMRDMANSEVCNKNMAHLMKRYPDGLQSYIIGRPVIA